MNHNISKNSNASERGLILLTGASGYIGGRLLSVLELQGKAVRCLARRPEFLQSKVTQSTEVVAGDVLDRDSLISALKGVHTAYYMVHSMGSSGSFEQQDRRGATNFAEATQSAGVERIIYLGGLGEEDESLSPHLRSRQEVGRILRDKSGAKVLEFRASIVIGSGSLSFEMIRALVERLPIMIMPKWVSVLAQPIAVEDLIQYLTKALELPMRDNLICEIGGADRVSYADIMRVYGKCRNIRTRMIPVPMLTPYLSSLWLGLVTPLYTRIGRKLIESIVHSTVVHDESAQKLFDIQPMGIEEAIRHALANEDRQFAETRWSDALSSAGEPRSWFGVKFGSRMVDSRTLEVDCPPQDAFKPIACLGGNTGYYAWNWLWKLRGFMDMLVGGVGFRRGRPHPLDLRVGDPVDFWRVEKYEPNHLLRLTAEMKLPGRAWLEFEVNGDEHKSTIRQTAIFDPVGLWGRLYWYFLYPFHQFVFKDMLRGIAKRAKK